MLIMMAVGKLSQVLSSDYKGPRARFSETHVLKALLTIGEFVTVGRGRLGKTLNIGQGEVRTLIKRLKESGLISIGAEGCRLSIGGKRQYDRVSKIMDWRSEVDGSLLRLGRVCYAILLRGRSGRVRKGIEQRDAAIKSGALAALTVFYSKGKFLVPYENEDCEPRHPSEPWITIRSAKPKEGDAIIVSVADDLLGAEYGALAAALTLL